MGLVEHSGSYGTVLMHRITLFKSHPVNILVWDGKVLGFGGDVMPGNHIKLMEVLDDAFTVSPEHVIPTLGNVNHLLSGNPAVEMLGPNVYSSGPRHRVPQVLQDGTSPSSLSTFAAGLYPHTPPVVGTSGGSNHHGCQGSGVWGAAQLDSSSPHRVT